MSKYISFLFFFVLALFLFLSSWYAINGDMYIHTDIARDFHLLDEIDEKKIVLIGPRSSAGGLFHGPHWLYLLYPGYLLGNGNPVVMAWYWIFLTGVFLLGSYFVAKRMFDSTVAKLYVLLLAGFLLFLAREFLNPIGAFFVMPFFIYTFYTYVKKRDWRYLAGAILLLGLMIQFQMAAGAPILILTGFATLFVAIKYKKYFHPLLFALIPLSLINFIVFDVRHGFNLTKAYMHNLSSEGGNQSITYLQLVLERIERIIEVQLINNSPDFLNSVVFFSTVGLLILAFRHTKDKLFYFLFVYFYVGYFILSLLSKHAMLNHQFYPILPLLFLCMASFVTIKKYKSLATIFVVVIIFANLVRGGIYAHYSSRDFIGYDQDSWKFLHTIASDVYSFNDDDFGYFVYAPDTFAYEPKYAMYYTQKEFKNQGHRFEKRHITYLVIAPPPPDKPFMGDRWWTENKARISNKPVMTKTYPNGFKIEKYVLTDEEIAIQPDPMIDPGISSR